jgi:hypothetical protein
MLCCRRKERREHNLASRRWSGRTKATAILRLVQTDLFAQVSRLGETRSSIGQSPLLKKDPPALLNKPRVTNP